MPIYDVTIPGVGDFEVESDKELTDEQAYKYALMQSKKESPQPAKKTISDTRKFVEESFQPKQAQGMALGDIRDIPRQLGLAARLGATSIASLPAMLAEPVAAVTGQPNQMAQLQKLLTQLGLPEAQNPQERLVQDIGSAIGGVAAPAKAFQGAPNAFARMFTESPEAQAAAATASAALSGIGREQGVSPEGQFMLGMVGAMAPGAKPLGQAGVRGAKEAVRPFTEAGREVIVGNVLRSLAREPEAAMKAAGEFKPAIGGGYTPTTAQATRDIGLIAAETPIRGMDTFKFAEQTSQANKARMNILDRMAKDKDALTSAIAKRDSVTAPMREAAFEKSTVSPDTFQSAIALNVGGTIDNIMQSPVGARGSVAKTMDWAKNQLSRAKTPQELYEVRKDLRDAAQGLLDKEGSAYSLAKGQLEQVIRSVDDVIDSAAPGYRDYLKKYAQASKGIESMEAAQAFRSKVLTTTPDPMNVGDFMISQPAFTRAIRSLEQDPQGLSKTQIAVLKKVGEDLDSGVLNRAGKVPGSDTFKNLSTANLIGGIIGKQITGMPAAMQKAASPLNWLYNGTDDQIRELLVDAMVDPKLASRLMAKANVMTVEPLSKELQKRAIALGYGASFGLTE